MNRSRRVALAALCVLALALGAATLDSPVADDDDGFGGSGSDGIVDGPATDSGGSTRNGTSDLGAIIDIRAGCIPFFTSSTFYLIVLGLSLVVASLAYRRGGGLLVFAIFGTLFPPGLVLWMLVTACGDPSLSQRSQNFSIFPGQNGTISTGAGGGGGAGSSLPPLSTSILVVLGIAIVLVALLLLRASDDDIQEREDELPEDDDLPESLAGLAGVAGEAADRIEAGDEDTENEVYRAWREMTDLLAVDDPRTSTPAEFREAATAAGMSQRHVAALTDLFRDVRYGGADANEDRESRAIDALRSIEEAYGPVDDESDSEVARGDERRWGDGS